MESDLTSDSGADLMGRLAVTRLVVKEGSHCDVVWLLIQEICKEGKTALKIYDGKSHRCNSPSTTGPA